MSHAPRLLPLLLLATLLLPSPTRAQVYNLKVLTDASPDYSDLPSFLHSTTSRWQTPEQKCWALFYWNHKARRQTNPMHLHGLAVTDPIRQFNDFGHTMCSTISGINCGIWNTLGLPSRYWDISNHTVSEVFYDGRWHMYDNSMTAIYTLCDGKTIAGVEDIGKTLSCDKSHNKSEPGHIAKYHCLTATSPNGFLTGADTIRSLDEEYRCFNPNGLKYRPYFYDQDLGHRYILNLRPNESYTRHYHSLGDSPEFYVPLNGKDPEALNKRYHLRGNGQWLFKPDLTPKALPTSLHSSDNITATDDGSLHPTLAGLPAETVFKINSANIATAYAYRLSWKTKTKDDEIKVLISADNGAHWLDWTELSPSLSPPKLPGEGEIEHSFTLPGSYEMLFKVRMLAKAAPTDISFRDLQIETTTQLNSKTQPRLNLGRNTVYVGAGPQTESLVLWPELQNDAYKQTVHAEHNIKSTQKHPGYMGTIHPARPNEDAHLVYRLSAPRDLTRLTFGGRFYNRAKGSHITLLYSLDDGKTWTQSWSLTKTDMPWDVIHYETVTIPPGHRSALVKFLLNTPDPAPSGCSIYALRVEANYKPADPTFHPFHVTFRWKERQPDYSLQDRSHTQRIDHLPATYTIDVEGADHPQMDSLTISSLPTPPGAHLPLPPGEGRGEGVRDSQDAPPTTQSRIQNQNSKITRHIPHWQTLGKNLAVGKPYTLSHPSDTTWDAGDPTLTKLTDGLVGPPCAGGTSYRSGALWSPNKNPTITLDLGSPTPCASFGLNFHGYPFHDALKGQIKDKAEVLVSDDGTTYRSLGHLHTALRRKDLPANHFIPDDEALTGHTFRLIPEAPVTTRYVQYKITNPRHFCATEIEILDSIQSTPFDLRLALPPN